MERKEKEQTISFLKPTVPPLFGREERERERESGKREREGERERDTRTMLGG